MGQAIKAGDLRLCRIDIFVPGFLAREDVVPVELPPILTLLEAAAQRKETASSCLSFDEEIDQFQLEEKGEVRADPVEI